MTERTQSASIDLTVDDARAERTGNGLRPLDEALPQPSQAPTDVPASLLGPDGELA